MDSKILIFTRIVRMFSFGAISVVLFLFLEKNCDLSPKQVGHLFTAVLLGDLLITFPLTTRADKFGRKKTLIISALLKVFSGLTFATSTNIYLIAISAILGVISPTGGEIGPFMAVEQAAIVATLKKHHENEVEVSKLFSFYSIVGYFSQALGSLCAGFLVKHWNPDDHEEGYVMVNWLFSICGLILFTSYLFLSNEIEPVTIIINPTPPPPLEERLLQEEDEAIEKKGFCLKLFGLNHQKTLQIVLLMSSLFCLDSFAGGFVMQTLIVSWFDKKYKLDPAWLGSILSGINVLSGLSFICVPFMVARYGALITCVITHLPSNILLLLVPFMPNAHSAVIMLFARSSLSQMDVPARSTFVAMSVEQDERSAAGGITILIRSLGVSISPLFWGPIMNSNPQGTLFKTPFIIAGVLKIIYDLLLYISFRSMEQK